MSIWLFSRCYPFVNPFLPVSTVNFLNQAFHTPFLHTYKMVLKDTIICGNAFTLQMYSQDATSYPSHKGCSKMIYIKVIKLICATMLDSDKHQISRRGGQHDARVFTTNTYNHFLMSLLSGTLPQRFITTREFMSAHN